MNKYIYIVIGVVVLVLLAAGAWSFYSGSMPGLIRPVEQEQPALATASAPGQTADTVKATMPDAVGKVNPFKADVNPVSGYQNPFE